MIERKRVAVIGGGVSGLAAARAFGRRGHTVLGFERGAALGGVWEPARSYAGVRTQSPKDLYRFTDEPMPADYPEWPTGAQVHAYLHGWADKHDLGRLFALRTDVRSMRRRDDAAPGWTLVLEGDGRSWSEDVDFVAVCTGQFSRPHVPRHPGQEDFEARGGTVLHSSGYTDASRVAGNDVVVLGGSKSATDIAVDAAAHGARSVTMVYREKVWRVPHFVGGINFKRLLYMRAQEIQFDGWNRTPLAKLAGTLARPLVWANFRALETLLKLQLGLKRWDMVPDGPIDAAVSCALPLVTPGLFEAFASGDVRPVRGTFRSFGERSVRLDTGETIDCDVAVLAVGWKLGVPFLSEQDRHRLVEADGQYRLYRQCINPELPDMGFVGFNSSFCTLLSAELGAEWLVRYADGQLVDAPDAARMNAEIDSLLRWRREERPSAQVYGGLCVAPFHFRHFDELLGDIGARRRRRRNVFAEQFSYPDADAYGGFLASASDYAAG